MKNFESGELRIEIKVFPGHVRLTWFGQSNERDPNTVLRPFFDEVAGLCSKEREIELDFREFDYMNSSTFRPILSFVQSASRTSRSVNVRYDAQKNWQRLSFKTLQAVSASLGNVRVES
jgi:hypothetical protein